MTGTGGAARAGDVLDARRTPAGGGPAATDRAPSGDERRRTPRAPARTPVARGPRRPARPRRLRPRPGTGGTLRGALRKQRPTSPPNTEGTAARPPARARAAPLTGAGPRTGRATTRPGTGRTLVRAGFRLTGPDGLPGVTVDAAPGLGGTPGTSHAGAVATRALAEAGLGHLGGHLRLRVYGREPAAAATARAVRRAVRRAVTTRHRP
ncbi:MAG TPA: hypothetical protein VFP69_08960 [Streptomyces sp.]|nr:hypothetical protein [Streptomyces sp.]